MFKINKSLWSDPNYTDPNYIHPNYIRTCTAPVRVPFLSALNDFQAASGP
jgi:hypothetical protein